MSEPHDPVEELASFDPGPSMNPMPPSEVRRRGERLRRRNTVLAGVGAAAAVALIVTPLAILGARGDGDTGPDPAPAPTAPTETAETPKSTDPVEIPNTFPLAAGWPDQYEPGGNYGLVGPSRSVESFRYSACGTDLTPPDVADALRARWSNPEDFRTRELLSLPDADQAVAFVDFLVDFYEACSVEQQNGPYSRVTEVRDTQVGGQSVAVVRATHYQSQPTVGLEILHVVRLGSAVLIDTASNEGGGGPDPEAEIQAQIDEQATGAADVVAAMCAFTEAGC